MCPLKCKVNEAHLIRHRAEKLKISSQSSSEIKTLILCPPEPDSSHSLHGPGRVGGRVYTQNKAKPKARPNWYKAVSDSLTVERGER